MSDLNSDAIDFENSDTAPVVYVRAVAASEVFDRAAQSDIDVQRLEPADGPVLYAVHDETGRRVGVFAERNMAFAAARWHGAAPVSVH